MKKYYPVDFDEKGNAVLGNAKSTPTSNSFVPTTWAPGGSDDGEQGIESIAFSPAIETTPSLDSFFPIHYGELTEEQKTSGVEIILKTTDALSSEYTVTITPTAEWYARTESGMSNKGEAITAKVTPFGDRLMFSTGAAASPDEDEERRSDVMVVITKSGK